MGVRGSSDATITIWVRVAPSSFYSHCAMHCGADVGNEGPSTVHYNSRCIVGYFESTTLGCNNAHYTVHSDTSSKWPTPHIVHYIGNECAIQTQP